MVINPIIGLITRRSTIRACFSLRVMYSNNATSEASGEAILPQRNRRLHLPKQTHSPLNPAHMEPRDGAIKKRCCIIWYTCLQLGNYVRTVMETKVANTTTEVECEGQEGRFKA